MKIDKAARARNLRYKRPALASMGWEMITYELSEITEQCDNVRYCLESDEDKLLNALDGDTDELSEFKLAFGELSAKADQLNEILYGSGIERETYDDCTVALIGNRYRTIGYDEIEEDYYGLTSFEEGLARTEAGARLMRMTKAQMISTIGQCFGTLLAFYGLRHNYDYLRATMDLLSDENTAILDITRQIDAAYDAAARDNFYEHDDAARAFDALIAALPDRTWVEL